MIGDIIAWLVIGVAAGWLAGVITKTDRSIWGDLALGLVGAFVAGLIVNGIDDDNLFFSIVAAAVAAVVLVLLKNMLLNRRAT